MKILAFMAGFKTM